MSQERAWRTLPTQECTLQIRASLSCSKQTSTEMQTPHEFRFMALPVELCCHVYTFLIELVYKPVFPTMSWSPVGTCCWPVYRMPTSLLQVSKDIHEEIGDTMVQNAVQKLNDHHQPTIVLDPFFRQTPAFSQMPFLFWKVASGAFEAAHEHLLGKSRAQYLSHRLADWIVWHLSHTVDPQDLPPWDFSNPEEPGAVLECIVHPFVEQTLKRMGNNHAPEVHIRFLIRENSSTRENSAGYQLQRRLYEYSVQLGRNDACYENHHSSDVCITFAVLDIANEMSTDNTFTGQLFRNLKRKGLRFGVEQPCAEDQRLFNKSGSFDQS